MASVCQLHCSEHIFVIMIIVLVLVSAEPYSENGKASGGSQLNHIASSGAALFNTRNNTRIIAQRGGLAVLPCAVKLNPSATVSWIRRLDFQLLTVGLSTYSSDDRFLVEHARHMGHWSLRIKSVRDEDRGLYECQLSIYPTQSIFVELKVVEAVAEIVGAPDLHIDEGSTLRLECKLKLATENPAFVFWYHDNKMVNYDTQDGFSVSSIPTPHQGHHSNIETSATGSSSSAHRKSYAEGRSSNGSLPQGSYLKVPSPSVLTIQEVHFKHAGNYTCAPSNARPGSITVHVLQGEKPAAMQHANRSTVEDGKSNSNSLCYSVLWCTSMLFLISVFHKINR